MIKNLILTFLLFSPALYCQSIYENYDWDPVPEKSASDTVKCVNGVAVTLERRITEVYANKDNVFEEISIFHKKIRVESHDAIDEYNKIYVPISNVIQVLNIKARFIGPDGKVTEVPKESIRQVNNLENQGDFKTFVIEGAEVGGEIEYFYTLRKKFDPFGSIFIQSDIPKANVEVVFAYPSKLKYMIKSYNGFPDFIKTSDDSSGMTFQKAKIGYIPALKSEKYSNYTADLMRYEYTLAYNNYHSLLRTYSWSKAAYRLYSNMYVTEKGEQKAINKLLKTIDPVNEPEINRVRAIENWVKSEITISDENGTLLPLDKTLKQKQTNSFGATRLFVALFNNADIPIELVVTSDLTKRLFDPDFDSWNFLDKYLIWFPDLKEIMVPDDASYRLGIIPSSYQGNYGLFLHPISYNNTINTLAYDIKKVPEENFRDNTDSLMLKVDLNMDQLVLNAHIKRYITGDIAQTFQSFWSLVNEDKHKDIIQSLFNMGTENTKINNYTIKNTSPVDIGVNPLIWTVDLTANSLVESAGNALIIKIGETIGEQEEIYQNSVRQLPVHMDELRNYYRKIEFTIPEGYKIANASDLKMKVEKRDGGKISCAFYSDYSISGNTLTIISREFYKKMDYPVSQYEDFRKVINASADFNKKTIVLTKE